MNARRTISPNTPIFPWVSYAVAVGLMSLGIFLALQILDLKAQLLATRADAARLRKSNALMDLRLVTLVAKDAATDPSYSSSQIVVAWDPYQHQGVVALQHLPTPSSGHDYQLWVLDPTGETPLSAGLLTASRSFVVTSVNTQNPGFAISLEPSGGSSMLSGPILFAVAPGP